MECSLTVDDHVAAFIHAPAALLDDFAFGIAVFDEGEEAVHAWVVVIGKHVRNPRLKKGCEVEKAPSLTYTARIESAEP